MQTALKIIDNCKNTTKNRDQNITQSYVDRYKDSG